MPLCTSADSRLDRGMIAYGPHTRATATSVPAISPRGTLRPDPERAAALSRVGRAGQRGRIGWIGWIGAVQSRGMVTPVEDAVDWLANTAASEPQPIRRDLLSMIMLIQ